MANARAVLISDGDAGELHIFNGCVSGQNHEGPLAIAGRDPGHIHHRTATDPAGLARDERRVLSGESWQQGQVILSWDDVLAGAADPADGRNVVIHEFAHQLDQESGRANGAPWLGSRERHARWALVLGAEFAALRQRLAEGESGLMDPYAATDPAEFFAYLSELFFEQPAALAAAHPALYGELRRYYRSDPLVW